MAKDFYSAVKDRRSFYDIIPESKVSDQRIEEIIKDALLYAPSAFNSQSARVLLMLGEQHKRVWDFTKEALAKIVDANNWQATEDKLHSFAKGYGTVLFFDDDSVVVNLQDSYPTYKDKFPVWAEQANGILQYIVWVSLQAEGFGASLQHYNPLIDNAVKEAWSVPDDWRLIAQMPFGVPSSLPPEKSKLPINERFMVQGGHPQ